MSGYARSTVSVSSVAKRTFTKYRATYTDERFWKIFDYTFLNGAPFTYEDNESGIRKAVISEKLARRLFGKTEVKGQRLFINRTEYTVCGVVKDVPRTAVTPIQMYGCPIIRVPLWRRLPMCMRGW